MEITWLGHSCFRLKGKEATILTDPHDGFRGKPVASIVTLSHYHPRHSYLQGVGGSPRVISGPGEYEVSHVFITGFRTFHDAEKGAKRGKNTVYVIEVDEVRVCHLGDLGHVPSLEQVEEMAPLDVLLVPVGGVSALDARGVVETISLLEPKIVIPMHYRTQAQETDLEPLDRFLKEMGLKETPGQPKLSVARSSLPEDRQVVVLDYLR